MTDVNYPSRALNSGIDSVTVVNSTPITVSMVGGSTVFVYYLNYAATNVTTAAYTQVLASTSAAINRIYISDTSGSFMMLATGAAGSESPKLYIGPGGQDSVYDLAIPAGTRISIRALDVNATQGKIVITALS